LKGASKATARARNNDNVYKTIVDPATLEEKLGNDVELDMDKFSAEEALDSQFA